MESPNAKGRFQRSQRGGDDIGERSTGPGKEDLPEISNAAEDEDGAKVNLGMGWLPDYPDFRDLTIDMVGEEDVPHRLQKLGRREPVGELLGKIGVVESQKVNIPTERNLKKWCPPIEDQGDIGSCTANAGVALVEYFERRAFERHIDASRLFLYKATRNLLHSTGDTGAFLRTTMGAMVLFGVPPEEYWPYVEEDFDKEPSSFCYSYAKEYQAIQYFRLDPPGTSKNLVLDRIKLLIFRGLPSMFGFTIFSSIGQARRNGEIPYPCPRRHRERIVGGHAIVAVGFDDDKKIENRICGEETTGALFIRNSWGTSWGRGGYGWLPYKYVEKGLARDWWSLITNEYVESEQFGH